MTRAPEDCSEPSLRPGADPAERCGAAVAAHGRCLAHLDPADLDAHLAGLAAGAPIQAYRTVFTAGLLPRLLHALTDDTGHPHLKESTFRSAIFTEDADFSGAAFSENATFRDATFTKNANFRSTTFTKVADFRRATFTEEANFRRAAFTEDAIFRDATFTESAGFFAAAFTKNAYFNGATFIEGAGFFAAIFTKNAYFFAATFDKNAGFGRATFANAYFEAVTFVGDADFRGVRFAGGGRFRCSARRLVLSEAQVVGELLVDGAIGVLEGVGVRAEGRVSLRLRGTRVSLDHVVCTGLLTVHGLPSSPAGVPESQPAERDETVVLSLTGVDADRLVLTDVDLSWCRFAGIQRLDQIKLDGRCTFATDPSGMRQVLAEEHYWRHTRGGRRAARWAAAPDGVEVVGPDRVQVLYRQLRKAFEEGKNEPGAADFYYGEMEMRRAAAPRRLDRWLLNGYWATSGYALRARRALACLALVVALTIVTLTLWGFPAKGKDLKADGTLTTATGGQPIAVTIHQSDPTKKLPDRIGKATEITLNAVIFRAPDTELTTTGRYIDIAARLLGPLFLGFSLLAIRNRVKR